MGIPKTSRKGKKAWRQNISTADVDKYFVEQDKEARTGGPVDKISKESLFFVDKSKDVSLKRKFEKQRSKVLKYESILQGNPFMKPIPTSKKKQKKKKISNEIIKKISCIQSSSTDTEKDNKKGSPGILELWNNKGTSAGNGEKEKQNCLNRKIKKPIIPAVEVELPGCSYNPPHEAHQDALALAVAEEMQKMYKRELQPEPVPKYVEGEPVDEETAYFLDVDAEEDEGLDTNENEGDTDQVSRAIKIRRLTRAELNRKARRQEQLKIVSEKKKRENLEKDIECLSDIMEDIEKEKEKKEKKRIRLSVARQERLLKAPPRLGKYKFKPEPTQVLLSEEITGSLRKLKGCNTLARDRFNSLIKRGYMAPSKRAYMAASNQRNAMRK